LLPGPLLSPWPLPFFEFFKTAFASWVAFWYSEDVAEDVAEKASKFTFFAAIKMTTQHDICK
jgi:hypothetical protein